jgi:hypothetical protein
MNGPKLTEISRKIFTGFEPRAGLTQCLFKIKGRMSSSQYIIEWDW